MRRGKSTVAADGAVRLMGIMIVLLMLGATAQAQEFQLTIGWAGAGTVEVDGTPVMLPYSMTYDAGTTVTVDPIPIDHWGFHRWTGDVEPANIFNDPLQVTMNSDITITPHFQRVEFLLTVQWAAGGTIRVNGVPQTLPYSAYFPCNSNVAVDVVERECFTFQKWTGDVSAANETDVPLIINTNQDFTIRPNFIQDRYTLSIGAAAAGTVTVNGNPVTLPYSQEFACNAEVVIDAVPDNCWAFDRWTGDVPMADINDDPLTLVMDQDRSINPHFRQITYTLELMRGWNGSVMVNGILRTLPYSEEFDCDEVVTLEAIADECWQFSQWVGDVPSANRTRNPLQIVMNQDRTIRPAFAQVRYDLTIQWAGAGTVTVNGSPVDLPYSATFDCDEVVNIDAIPNDCWEFQRWTGDVPQGQILDDPLALTMNQDRTIRPNFRQIRYTLEIGAAAAGTVLVNGNSVTLPYSAQFPCDAEVVVDAIPDDCWGFDRWIGDVPMADIGDDPLTLIMDQNRSIAPTFAQLQFELNIEAAGNGSVRVNGNPVMLPFSQTYDCDAVVTVEAFPNECWQLSQWVGDVPTADRRANPLQLTMNQDRTIRPAFARVRYELTIERAPAGMVTVNGNPVTLPYTATFNCNEVVTIDPAPNDPCWEFQRWTGDVPSGSINDDPLMLTMDQDRTIKPNFQRISYTLQLNRGWNGSVIVNGTTRMLPYSEDFRCGEVVTLEAVANTCWQFSQWVGDIPMGANTNNPLQVTMNQDRTIRPAFAQASYELTIEAAAAGTVTVNGNPVMLPYTATFDCNEVVNIDAIPNSCWELDRWVGDVPAANIKDDPLALTMNQNRTIRPAFRQIRYTLEIEAAAAGGAMVNGVTQTLPYSQGFPCNTLVTVCAVPDVGFTFDRWTGDLPGSVEPTDLTIVLPMDQHRTIRPHFQVANGTPTSAQLMGVNAMPTAAGAEVAFTLSAPASVSAEVLNIAGRTVKHIVTDRDCEQGVQSLAWNGVSDLGTKAPSGAYLVRVTVRDGSGASSERLVSLQLR